MELSEFLVKIIQSDTEELCYELKWDVDISRKNKGGQAEFMRDVLSLANAAPHNPRDRYLVMNAAKGKVNPDAHALRVDDATYQQLIRSWVAPPMGFRKRVEVTTLGDVAVIIVENSHEFPYKVRKTLRDDEKVHLQQDECWTRSGSAKRPAESDDFVAMGAAKASAERRIGPSGVPNADALIHARIPVTSSNVGSIGYDSNTQTLEVDFNNGAIYQYFDVPQAVHEELMSAPSKGKYMHAHVKGVYRYART